MGGDHDFLVRYFADADTGEPDEEYLDRVRERFGRWTRDTCDAPYDQDWLDYQFEIARRHHRTKKNETDGANSVPNIDLRYVVAFVSPITATVREFLDDGDHSPRRRTRCTTRGASPSPCRWRSGPTRTPETATGDRGRRAATTRPTGERESPRRRPVSTAPTTESY